MNKYIVCDESGRVHYIDATGWAEVGHKLTFLRDRKEIAVFYSPQWYKEATSGTCQHPEASRRKKSGNGVFMRGSPLREYVTKVTVTICDECGKELERSENIL